MTKKSLSISQIINQRCYSTAQLRQQIDRQLALLERLKGALPDQIAGHVVHCVLKKNKLLVYTGSASWASQLRFYANVLIKAIGDLQPSSVSLQIKVLDPKYYPAVQKHRSPNLPSRRTISQIRMQSEAVADPLLKQSLLKLSETFERLS